MVAGVAAVLLAMAASPAGASYYTPYISSSPANGDTYRAGENIVVKLRPANSVVLLSVTGTVYMSFNIGGLQRRATVTLGTDTWSFAEGGRLGLTTWRRNHTVLQGTYTVVAADRDTDGMSITSSMGGTGAIGANTGYRCWGFGSSCSYQPSLTKTHNSLSTQSGHKVDGRPYVTLALSNDEVTEGGSVNVTATLSAVTSASSVPITVSATGSGFRLSSNRVLTIPKSSTRSIGTVTIMTTANTVDEPDRSVVVSGTASGQASSGVVGTKTLTIEDDDALPTATLHLSSTTLAENGGSTTVTASLNHASSEATTLTVGAAAGAGAAASDFSLSTNRTLTIPARSTSSTGTVTITANDNFARHTSKSVTVSATTSGGRGIAAPSNLSFSITDNDTPGITTGTVSNMGRVTEAAGGGRTATFTVRLDAVPTANVVIGVSSGDTSEASVSPSSLTFTASNWNQTQTVTITGVDEFVDDGNQTYDITLASPTSTDTGFSSLDDVDIEVVTVDNDTAGVTASAVTGQATEAGGTSTFTVRLDSAPEYGRVNIGVVSRDTGEGTVSPTILRFSHSAFTDVVGIGANQMRHRYHQWNSPQTVTVTGVNDFIDDGTQTYNITLMPAGTAPKYNRDADVPDVNVSVTTTDDDVTELTVVESGGTTLVTEGSTDTFTVQLGALPSASVTVDVTSADIDEGTVSPSRLTFTTGNWNQPQTVTLTGVNDNMVDGDQTYNITLDPASTDTDYNGLSNVIVGATTGDMPAVSLMLSSASIAEDGGTSTVTASLARAVSSPITITVAATPAAGTLAGNFMLSGNKTLTIAAGDTASMGTVTITGVNDNAFSPNKSVAVSATVGGAGRNLVVVPSAVTLSIGEDERGFILTPPAGGLTEGGTADITMKLSHDITTGLVGNTWFWATGSFASGDPCTIPLTRGGRGGDRTDGNIIVNGANNHNRNTVFTYRVSATDNNIDDNTQSCTLTVRQSGGLRHAGFQGVSASIVIPITDDDTAGLTVVESGGSTQVTEAATTDTFTVKLATEPTANVTVAVSSEDTGEGTVNPTSLTFTTANWNSTQTVTVTGVDDNDTDGTQTYNIVLDPSSSDTNYHGLSSATVSVTTTDNETGLAVSKATLRTSETATTDRFTVKLASAPTAQVTVAITGLDTSEGLLSTTIGLTFTTGNWNQAQTVIVTGVDDSAIDGDIQYTLTLTPTSTDTNYNGGGKAVTVDVTNDDDDITTTLTLTPDTINESGATNSTTVTATLGTTRAEATTITVAIPDDSGATLSANKVLTIAAGATASSGAAVTITAADDSIDQGASRTVTVSGTASSDVGDPVDVTLTITDDEAAPTVTLAVADATIDESGASNTTTVTATLSHASTAETTVTVTPLAGAYRVAAAPNNTITIAAGDTTGGDDTVTITAVDDALDQGASRMVTVTGMAENGVGVGAVTGAALTITDDDEAGLTTSAVTGQATEAGGASSFTVKLNSEPTADVTVAVSSDDDGEGAPTPATLTFTTVNWVSAQTVTVTGANDDVDDGTQTYNIVLDPSSTDTNYEGLDDATVSVTTTDDDEAGLTTGAVTGQATEAGGTSTFTVKLATEPTDDVSVAVSSAATDEGTVSPGMLTFTTSNWNDNQTVTVAGVNDHIDDGTQTYNIVLNPDSAGDTNYGSDTVVEDVTVSVTTTDDNDTARLVIAHSGGTTQVTESGAGNTDTFTIKLNSEPTAKVTVAVRSNDTGEGTVSPAELTFTTANWNSTQTVTVTGVDDDIDDGTQTYVVFMDPASGGDSTYNTIRFSQLRVRTTDDDTVGLTVVESDGTTRVTEGGVDTFTVRLATEPTANVSVAVSSGATDEGTVDPAGLTFTSGNWNHPQTVTVTGVSDGMDDGVQTYVITLDPSSPAPTGDTKYDNLTSATVSASTNDEMPIVTLMLSPSSITENGGTTAVTARLSSAVSTPVTITVGATAGSGASASDFRLSGNNVLRIAAGRKASTGRVTITGVDNSGFSSDKRVTVSATVVGSSGVLASDVILTIIDDERGFVLALPAAGGIREGGSGDIRVRLSHDPRSDARFYMTASFADGDPCTIPTSFVGSRQTVGTYSHTIFVDGSGHTRNTIFTYRIDAPPNLIVDRPPRTCTLTVRQTAGQSGRVPGSFNGVSNSITIPIIDANTAGLVFSEFGGSTVVTEAGGTDQIEVFLRSEPSANVVIRVSSDDTGEGTVNLFRTNSSTLTFIPATWNHGQTVVVTGVDDDLVDGTQEFSITFTAESTDPDYNGLSRTFDASTTDDEAGLVVGKTALTTSEAATEDSLTVKLASRPSDQVTVEITGLDSGEGSLSTTGLTFTTANWSSAQTVTVTGVDDNTVDGDIEYTLTLTPTSTDSGYNGSGNAVTVDVTNGDDDITTTLTLTSGTINESGASNSTTVTATLGTTRAEATTITVAIPDDSGATLSANKVLTIAAGATASSGAAVTITATDDSIDQGTSRAVTVSGTASSDVGDPVDVTLTITDDEAAPTVTLAVADTTIDESGTAAETQTTVTATLSHASTAETTVTVTPLTGAYGVAASPLNIITIAAGDTTSDDTVTITAVDDALDQGASRTGITVAATAENGVGVGAVTGAALTITDDDEAGVATGAVMGQATEMGGTSSFTVALTSEPTANVTITVTSGATDEGAASPGTLTFTPANWVGAQMVTVTGVDDDLNDGTQTYDITLAAASGDTRYGSDSVVPDKTVSVSTTDDDTAGLMTGTVMGQATETGGTSSFTVRLNTQPTANVTITVTSGDTDEGTVNPGTLTFASTNWNTNATVTITGQDDALTDGTRVYDITLASASTDTDYNTLTDVTVGVSTTDDDSAGLTVVHSGGLTTVAEAAGTDTFTVVLNKQPTADVTVAVTSGADDEGTAAPGTLTFTNSNWNAVQTVTVTGVDDYLDDGDQTYNITLAPASTGDSAYDGLSNVNVGARTTDDDTTGLTTGPVTGQATEAGGTSSFTVALSSEPTADVTVAVSSGDTDEGTVGSGTLTFTASNWNSTQTVTVTGADDAIDDGDQTYDITLDPASAGDTNYNTLASKTVGVSTTDDSDAAGLTASTVLGQASEASRARIASFLVKLNTEPVANVTVGVVSGDTGEGTVDPTNLTFTPANWNDNQMVRITGVDDNVDDGDQTYDITLEPHSLADANYRSDITVPDETVSVTTIDDDTVGLMVVQSGGATTVTEGGVDTFTVKLASRPTANVTVAVTSGATDEGTVSPGTLTFTANNWNSTQTVTLTGVADSMSDGVQTYNITLDPASSGDTKYDNLDNVLVSASTTDDMPAVTLILSSPTITEDGATTNVTASLASAVSSPITITVAAAAGTRASAGDFRLSTNKVLRIAAGRTTSTGRVTITGVDNTGFSLDKSVTVSATVGGAGAGLVTAPSNVTLTIVDNERGFVLTLLPGGLTEGSITDIRMKLSHDPQSDARFYAVGALASGDAGVCTIVHSAVGEHVGLGTGSIFVDGSGHDRNTVFTYRISAVDNNVVDSGSRSCTLTVSAVTQSGGMIPGSFVDASNSITIPITEDDTAGLTTAHVGGGATSVSETGTTDTFTVKLSSEPTANVTVAVTSDATDEGTVNPGSLTFTSGNWNDTQTVTVTGQDDHVDDGDQAYNITLASSSSDTNYGSDTVVADVDVSVTTTDDDDAGLTTAHSDGATSVTEAAGDGRTDTFTVKLNSEPTHDVTITVTSGATDEGSVSPGTLTFTSSNWNSTQTVTVTGVDDDIDDGDVNYNINLASASTDANYGSDTAVPDVTVSAVTTDDDTAGLTVVQSGGSTTVTEAGGDGRTDTFTVKLNSEPTDSVFIGVTSDTTTEGTASPSSLTFTTSNWNDTQTVTVTGVDDSSNDGDQTYKIILNPASSDTPYNDLANTEVSVTTQDDDAPGLTTGAVTGQATEAGGTSSFPVKLNTAPTADVTVTVTSGAADEGTASPGTLTFTSSNWNDNQTVTVTGQNDAIDDGTQTYDITLTSASTGDSDYNGLSETVSVSTTDDTDAAGITTGTVTGQATEAGGTSSFTVKLDSEPTANVTITVTSGATDEGMASPGTLTFTASNWNAAQTVTVTGANDHVDDGTQTYSITLASSSTDTNYGSDTVVADVTVSVSTTDDDEARVTFAHSSGSTQVTEAGGTDTFTVKLNSEPTADVTVAVSSLDTGEGTVSPNTLTFTTGNWNDNQTVTVTGANDHVDDGDQTYNIVLNPSSPGSGGDGNYHALSNVDVPAGTTDDDEARVTFAHSSGSTQVTEAGGTDTFTVKLNSEPTADVTVAVSSDDSGEGTASPNTLTFTSGNWNSTQTVTVTGQNDHIDDGTVSYNIVLNPSSPGMNGDSTYDGLDNVNVPAGTTDDTDDAGVTFAHSGASTQVTEATGSGRTDTFTVKLDSEPTANVTITVTSGATDEASVNPGTLTFTSGNWNSTQTVTVTGVDDDIDDGTQTYNITLASSSTDSNYGSDTAVPDVTVPASTTDDTDDAGVTFAHVGGGGTQVSETATTDTFTVKLDSEPTANVTITVTSGATDEASVNPGTLTFTSGNWNSTQTVTVTGVDDDIDDGTQTYNITLASSSTDSNYGSDTAVPDVTVPASTTDDTDDAGVTFAHVGGGGTQVSEATGSGRTDTFTVKLDSEPTANVTITVTSGATDEASVNPGTLTFTSGNWNSTQTVTVTGVDDDIDDGTQTYNITLASSSTDSNYGSDTAVPDVTVPASTTDDTDDAGVTFAHVGGGGTQVSEATGSGRTDTFTVKLDSEPTANVTITVTSGATDEASVNPGTLTFTSGNWNSTQTVTVTGVDDDIDDGTQTYNITLASSSSDSNYGSDTAVPDVTVPASTTDDTDAAGITFEHSSGSTQVSEAGGTDTFTVKLASEPTADVTVAVSSDATDEGTASPASLTFTSSNWNDNQTVTVTGVDDSSNDGTVTYNIDLDPSSPGMNGDSVYDGLDNVNVPVSTTDDDTPGITTGAVTGQATEAGGTSSFTVKLNTEPTADVTVAVSSAATDEGAVNPTSLTFTSSNWNDNQTVTVTGQNDHIDDGTVTYNIVLDPASTGDTDYGSDSTVPNVTVSVSTTDDSDDAGVTFAHVGGGGTQVSETATTDTFTVKLDTEPTANVTITVTSGATDEASVNPGTLTFTSGNWNSTQTVTVTGVDDDIDDGTQTYNITLASSSTDSNYGSDTAVPDVTVPASTTDDTDDAGVTFAHVGGGGTQVSETATTDTFTVKLDTEPTANVTITVTSGATDEASVNPGTLTFTSGNWNSTQTVTVTGVDDDIDDGTQTYNITLASSSTDTNYGSDTAVPDVTVPASTTDDTDDAGVTFAHSGASTQVTEATGSGRTDTFTVKLDSEPTANVTITVTSGATDEASVNPGTLTFTSGNWNSTQTVTVTGVDDDIDDGTQTYNITLASSSSDSNYGSDTAVPDVTVPAGTTDDDTAGITFAHSGASTQVTEATGSGRTDTFTVKLDSEPTANVTITVTSGATDEASVNPGTLTFTSGNWNSTQTVTVTGVDDDIDDGTQTYNITLASSSSDSNYGSDTAVPDVTVPAGTTDDDTAGITFAHSGANTRVTEAAGAGRTDTFTVKLDTQPTASVTIAVSSRDSGEASVSPNTMTFGASNWNSAVTVTVTGVDDDVDDGDQTYNIRLVPSGTDAKYNALNNVDVPAGTTDDDEAGLTVVHSGGSTQVTEAGSTDTFTVRLSSRPTASVTVAVSSDDPGEGTASPSNMTFTTGNWNQTQTVTVTGQDDSLNDDTQTYNIDLNPSSPGMNGDSVYHALTDVEVPASTTDNDTPGITPGTVTGQATEAGGTSSFTVKLNTEPTADVTIAVSSNDTSEGRPTPTSLTFTASNWNSAQTVTVTGQNDHIDDGTVSYNIILNPASTGDSDYNTLSNVTVGVDTTDDSDAAGLTVVHSGGATQVDEAGGTDTFTVKLASEPTADVTVAVSSDATDEGTASPTSLTFTSSNWNDNQTVTVTGVDDSSNDGTVTYNIVLNPSSPGMNGDSVYDDLNNVNVSVTTTDDDSPGLATGAVSGQATEAGGTSTFTVKLNTEPTAGVTIAVSSGDTGEGTPNPASLTFTTGNWNANQTVTVTGVDDDIDDGTQTYNIVLNPDSTGDSDYRGLSNVTVGVSTTDNDTAALTTGTVTGQATEAGGASAFTVKLATEPTANVTIAVSSEDTGEGTVSPTSLTFTPSNWNNTQAVTITGVDDFTNDGTVTYNIVLNPASGDTPYNALSDVEVSVTTTDNDQPGITTGTVTGQATEAGGASTFTVKLNTQPSANVTVAISSEDTGEGTVSPTSMTFTGGSTGNWNSNQTITVTGQDDGLNDGTQTYSIVLNPASTGDNDYNGLSNVTVAVTTTDDDEPGIVTGAVTGQATEAGGTSTFTVKLASQPTANVTIAVGSGATDEGRPTPASLTYTSGNWNSDQTVTVTGQNDDLDDGDQRYNITLDPSSTDSDYGTLATDTVSVTTTDDDTAGLTLSEARLTIAEGGSDSYTVVLDSEPTADVTVAIGKGNADVSLGATSLTFTSGNWDSAQTVTVNAAADSDDYADSDTVTHTVISTDSDYGTLATDTVAVAITGDVTIGGELPTGQEQVVVIGTHEITVVKESASVPQGVEITPSETLNQATRITFDTPSSDVPLESGAFALTDAEGVGTVVDIDVDPVPPGGVEVCLPVRGDLLDEAQAAGRSLTLTHYNTDTDAWEEVSGASYDAVTGLVCASGVTDFSPFGVAYPDRRPRFQGVIADQVYVLNNPIAALTLPAVSGGDAPLNGPTLTPQTLAPGLSFNAATRTLSGTPTEEREAVTYTWRVTDSDGDTAELQFTITVTNSREDERARLRDLNESILPELARVLADGVGTAIGRRLETVIGGGEHMMTSLRQLAQSNLQALEDGTFKWRNALNGQHFTVPLQNQEGEGAASAPTTAPMTFWATGDWHDLDMDNDDIDWDGDAFAYHLGIDKDLGGGKIAGLMASWFESDIDYRQRDDNDEIEGTHESEMLSIHPYFGWTSADGDRLWLTFGYGEGEIEIEDAEVEGRQRSDSILKTVAAGSATRLYEQGDWTLDLKGEGQYTQWRVKDNGDRIDGLTIDAYRLRASLQGTHNQGLTSGNRLISMLELGLRYDGGDGETGSGVELGGRLDYQGERVSIGTHGRILVAHEGDLDEWGVGGAIQVNADANGRGLSLTLTPTWGTTTSGIQRLWTEGTALRKEDEHDQDTGLQLESEISYGKYHTGGILTPYMGMSILEDGRHYRMGSRFNLRDTMTLNLEAERLEQDDTDTEHGIGVRIELQW